MIYKRPNRKAENCRHPEMLKRIGVLPAKVTAFDKRAAQYAEEARNLANQRAYNERKKLKQVF